MVIFDLFKAVMNDINDIINDKKGHNFANDKKLPCS